MRYYCPNCGTRIVDHFFVFKGKVICRQCLMFSGTLASTKIEKCLNSQYQLKYPLTTNQQLASQKILKYTQNNQSILVHAVCGAGKTELVIETISYLLSKNLKIGWMIARVSVVLEISQRLKQIFKHNTITALYGGCSLCLNADIVVLTAHQLYRYPAYFDCLIIDEPDAFPFKGDQVLWHLMEKSCSGTKIFLTATPDQKLKSLVEHQKLALVTLNQRPSLRPLPVPKVLIGFKWLIWIWVYYYFQKFKDGKTLFFVPSILLGNYLSKYLRIPFLSSLTTNLEAEIYKFRNQEKGALITTAILERGVTFSSINVVVVLACHPVFDAASLVQISGRVGRDIHSNIGECVFLANKMTKGIEECLNLITTANAHVSIV